MVLTLLLFVSILLIQQFDDVSSFTTILLSNNDVDHHRCTHTTLSALHLTPSQGNQLIAASSTAYGVLDDDDDDNNHIDHDKVATVSVRSKSNTILSLRQRFGLLNSNNNRYDPLYDEETGFIYDEYHHHDDKNDNIEHHQYPDHVEIFPIVGFVYVQDSPDHSRPLPTISNVSCQLHYQEEKDQVLYGWYTSRICHLQ